MAKQPHTGKWYGELLSGNRVIFVYTIGGEFIGEGALVFDNGDPDYTIPRQRIYLSRMIVKKEYRDRGIGKAIIDYLCGYAKNLGYSEMALGVDIDNHRARHLYEKKGFTTVIFEGEDEHGKYVKLLKTL
jgi:ribosomal protein S18 acetylase RimI-like enzyme